MPIIRRTAPGGARTEIDAMIKVLNAVVADNAALLARENAAITSGGIADGTTAGKLKTTADTPYRIGGSLYSKGATDDLWDLSGEDDTGEDTYRAYHLYLDAAGVASIGAGEDAESAADAIAALPAIPSTKSVIGVYVAGPSTDFDGVGGLAAQGEIHNGHAAAYTATAEAITSVPA